MNVAQVEENRITIFEGKFSSYFMRFLRRVVQGYSILCYLYLSLTNSSVQMTSTPCLTIFPRIGSPWIRERTSEGCSPTSCPSWHVLALRCRSMRCSDEAKTLVIWASWDQSTSQSEKGPSRWKLKWKAMNLTGGAVLTNSTIEGREDIYSRCSIGSPSSSLKSQL